MDGRTSVRQSRRSLASVGQIREWKTRINEYVADPNIDVFLVLKTEGVELFPGSDHMSPPAVEVMYPDGFIGIHPKEELEYDSRIIK